MFLEIKYAFRVLYKCIQRGIDWVILFLNMIMHGLKNYTTSNHISRSWWCRGASYVTCAVATSTQWRCIQETVNYLVSFQQHLWRNWSSNCFRMKRVTMYLFWNLIEQLKETSNYAQIKVIIFFILYISQF